eukprot:TRINITY_DN551_c0_g1_i2.p1 TRINITY_DN551_c0_g1~~TRINITY_DN551_c0_g1_i2.p1  ORF type:complete len:231 (-),score=52.13 TRINITY_DN551_c0_g1_i2:1014-1667(-)
MSILAREIEIFGQNLIIEQGKGEIGRHVWDGALVLSHFFENPDVFPLGCFKNKRVIELGSGTGLVGIVIALLGANVTLTDLTPMLPLIQENVTRNVPSANVRVVAHEWGSDVSDLGGPFDYVVLSDPLYIPKTYPLLIQSLASLTTAASQVIMAQEIRGNDEVGFFQQVKQHFTVSQVPNTQLDELWQSDDIVVVTMQKRSDGDVSPVADEQASAAQ